MFRPLPLLAAALAAACVAACDATKHDTRAAEHDVKSALGAGYTYRFDNLRAYLRNDGNMHYVCGRVRYSKKGGPAATQQFVWNDIDSSPVLSGQNPTAFALAWPIACTATPPSPNAIVRNES